MGRGEQQVLAGDASPDLPTAPPSRRRWVTGLLILCWVLLLAAVVVLGERPSTWARLEADIAAGRVEGVLTEGNLSPSGRGFSVVQVHWRTGLFAHRTEVVEVHPEGAPVPRSTRDGVSAVVTDLREQLAALDPQLRVTARPRTSGTSADVWGWQVGGWLVGGLVGLWVATFGILCWAGTTLRATRWAWFWLFWLLPVGPVAFLLLGVPNPVIGAPRGQRRLSGGWAFLILVIAGPSVAAGR